VDVGVDLVHQQGTVDLLGERALAAEHGALLLSDIGI